VIQPRFLRKAKEAAERAPESTAAERAICAADAIARSHVLQVERRAFNEVVFLGVDNLGASWGQSLLRLASVTPEADETGHIPPDRQPTSTIASNAVSAVGNWHPNGIQHSKSGRPQLAYGGRVVAGRD